MSDIILSIDGLSKNFGGVRAVQSVSLAIPGGRIFSVIGPNGAGKTTLINVLTGILSSSGGKVRFEDRDITDAPAHLVASAGMVRTFQNGRLFHRLTVMENVLVGAHHLLPQSVWSAIAGGAAARMVEIRQRAGELLATLGLADDADRLVGALPYGRQRMVEIARALVSKPKLLLLDEPTGGMSPEERHVTGKLLEPIKAHCALIIVEHDLHFIRDICDHLTVLDQGRVLDHGDVETIQRSPKVQQVFTTRV